MTESPEEQQSVSPWLKESDGHVFAAQQGHFEVAVLLIENGAEVDARDIQHRTVLMQAARCGNDDIALLLIERGADVNAICDWMTPLLLAVTAGQLSIAQLLLEQGADASFLDSKTGYNALMIAALQGHIEIVRLLLKCGSPVNQQTEWCVTALTMARRGRHEGIEAMLIAAGATEPGLVPMPVLMPWGTVGDPILCQAWESR